MQKGDDIQQQHSLTSDEISEDSATILLFNDTPCTSIVNSSNNGSNYTDIINILSQVELPSPSPVPVTSSSTLVRDENFINFDEGQPSGTKKVDEIEGNVDLEREVKVIHDNIQEPGTQPETHSTRRVNGGLIPSLQKFSTGWSFLIMMTNRVKTTLIVTSKRSFNTISFILRSTQRQRTPIHDRIRALKALIPNCNKRDQASILGDAIDYIKSLQMQLQMMQCMGVGAMPQGLYMSPTTHPSIQGPYHAPNYLTMRPMIGMGPYVDPYFASSLPVFPTFLTGFNPVPPMNVGIGSPRRHPIPYQHLIPPTVHSTMLSSDTINSTAISEVGSGISSQFSYHIMPVTSQETQEVSTSRVQAGPPNILLTETQAQMQDSDENDDRTS